MDYKLEKGIPLPKRPGRKPTYPFEQMHIGDSFFVKNGKARSLRNSATNASRKSKHRYAVRIVEGGVRIWRVK